MYTAIVESSFEATHAVRLPDGALEHPHAHTWIVRAEFEASELDGNDMVVDFCAALAALRKVLTTFEGQDLNLLPAFRDRTPTAEVVAQTIFDALRADFATLRRVLVTEAPGCVAAYQRGLRND